MMYLVLILMGFCAAYMLFRVLQALFTGVLHYKPRYQQERHIHFAESPREFLVILSIYIFAGAGSLWTVWSLIRNGFR